MNNSAKSRINEKFSTPKLFFNNRLWKLSKNTQKVIDVLKIEHSI